MIRHFLSFIDPFLVRKWNRMADGDLNLGYWNRVDRYRSSAVDKRAMKFSGNSNRQWTARWNFSGSRNLFPSFGGRPRLVRRRPVHKHPSGSPPPARKVSYAILSRLSERICWKALALHPVWRAVGVQPKTAKSRHIRSKYKAVSNHYMCTSLSSRSKRYSSVRISFQFRLTSSSRETSGRCFSWISDAMRTCSSNSVISARRRSKWVIKFSIRSSTCSALKKGCK